MKGKPRCLKSPKILERPKGRKRNGVWWAFLARAKKSSQRPLGRFIRRGKLRLPSKTTGSQAGSNRRLPQRNLRGQLQCVCVVGAGRTSFPKRPALPAGVSEPVHASQLGHRWPAVPPRSQEAPCMLPSPLSGTPSSPPALSRTHGVHSATPTPVCATQPGVRNHKCVPAGPRDPQARSPPAAATPRRPLRPGPRGAPPPPLPC